MRVTSAPDLDYLFPDSPSAYKSRISNSVSSYSVFGFNDNRINLLIPF